MHILAPFNNPLLFLFDIKCLKRGKFPFQASGIVHEVRGKKLIGS
jgi:hypothetical protein